MALCVEKTHLVYKLEVHKYFKSSCGSVSEELLFLMSVMFIWMFCASTAGGLGSIPGQGNKILHARSHMPYGTAKNKIKLKRQTDMHAYIKFAHLRPLSFGPSKRPCY